MSTLIYERWFWFIYKSLKSLWLDDRKRKKEKYSLKYGSSKSIKKDNLLMINTRHLIGIRIHLKFFRAERSRTAAWIFLAAASAFVGKIYDNF